MSFVSKIAWLLVALPAGRHQKNVHVATSLTTRNELMRPRSHSSRILPDARWWMRIFLGTCLVSGRLVAQDTDQLERSFNDAYKGKVLTLRNFSKGRFLRYDANANLVSGGPSGPWTLDASVEIERIKLARDNIEIGAKRINLLYDQGRKGFKDIRGSEITIEVNANRDQVDARSFQMLMNRIFLAADERLEDHVPFYWKQFLTGRQGIGSESQTAGGTGAGVIEKLGKGIEAPRPIHYPQPPYTEEARRAKLQGIVAVWVVVDEEGNVRDLRLIKPLGLGLDDEAAETVKTWKFRPATRNGTPVSVRVMVEISFRLF